MRSPKVNIEVSESLSLHLSSGKLPQWPLRKRSSLPRTLGRAAPLKLPLMPAGTRDGQAMDNKLQKLKDGIEFQPT